MAQELVFVSEHNAKEISDYITFAHSYAVSRDSLGKPYATTANISLIAQQNLQWAEQFNQAIQSIDQNIHTKNCVKLYSNVNIEEKLRELYDKDKSTLFFAEQTQLLESLPFDSYRILLGETELKQGEFIGIPHPSETEEILYHCERLLRQ